VVGNGADFWFTLPVGAQAVHGVTAEGDRAFSNDPLAATVLVVDDDRERTGITSPMCCDASA